MENLLKIICTTLLPLPINIWAKWFGLFLLHFIRICKNEGCNSYLLRQKYVILFGLALNKKKKFGGKKFRIFL